VSPPTDAFTVLVIPAFRLMPSNRLPTNGAGIDIGISLFPLWNRWIRNSDFVRQRIWIKRNLSLSSSITLRLPKIDVIATSATSISRTMQRFAPVEIPPYIATFRADDLLASIIEISSDFGHSID